ncbi:MAG TPA: hypothetical protein VKR05_06860, partial [Candidatus Cybelea sp.]|nr:hypothetical protein [Candidatus Cybelea sp.]
RAIGATGSIHAPLINLAAVAYERQNYPLALTRLHEALDLFDSMPDKDGLAAILELIAVTISALGDPARGVRLFGASDALRHTMHLQRYGEPGEYEAEVAKMRQMLGTEAFDVQRRIGASLTLERALEEARQTRFLETPRRG